MEIIIGAAADEKNIYFLIFNGVNAYRQQNGKNEE